MPITSTTFAWFCTTSIVFPSTTINVPLIIRNCSRLHRRWNGASGRQFWYINSHTQVYSILVTRQYIITQILLTRFIIIIIIRRRRKRARIKTTYFHDRSQSSELHVTVYNADDKCTPLNLCDRIHQDNETLYTITEKKIVQ